MIVNNPLKHPIGFLRGGRVLLARGDNVVDESKLTKNHRALLAALIKDGVVRVVEEPLAPPPPPAAEPTTTTRPMKVRRSRKVAA